MSARNKAIIILFVTTVAFGVCFAAWVLYGVLISFLVDKGLYGWNLSEVGILIGAPTLTGALLRLPVGVLCDQYEARIVFFLLMMVAAIPMFLVGYANSYTEFILAGLGFGVAGSSFAAGVAYTCVWFPKERVGTALGIFGMGNAGAAATPLAAPMLLEYLTAADLEGWRTLPRLYGGFLVATALAFWIFTFPRKSAGGGHQGFSQRLRPLRHPRVWRFGLYYAFFFGGFVALSQWLIPYYTNVYSATIVMAGFLSALFSLPSGVIRAIGGWMSDRWGARTVMYATLIPGLVLCVLLFPAAMIIHTPGQGVTTHESGIVAQVSPRNIVLANGSTYPLKEMDPVKLLDFTHKQILIWPTRAEWQEPVVKVGQEVKKGELLARGITRIFFQANQWIVTGLILLLGCVMGIGGAAVYKLIPTYFPSEVGVVGGLVGVMGALGGFLFPIAFGFLLQLTGLWTTNWMFLALLAAICLVWMQRVVQRMMRDQTGELVRRLEAPDR